MRVRFADSKYPGDGWRFNAFGAPPTLRIGATGQAVTDLQEMLNAHGYNTPINGRYDAISTSLAVTNFQLANGLKPDGIVGPLTWGKLNPKYTGPASAVTGGAGAVVIEKVVPASGGLFANVGSFFSDPINVAVGGVALLAIGWVIFGGKRADG